MATKRGPDFNWENMMKWWSAHSDGSHSAVSEDDKKHMEDEIYGDESFHSYAFDAVERVHHLAYFLTHNETQEDDGANHYNYSAQLEDDLDELKSLVDYIDVANELHFEAGGLVPLFYKVLCYNNDGVYNKHASVRAKAAEFITTMVQNNPKNQQLVMEVKGLQPLLYNFLYDPDITSRTKALGAISALIRNNKPGITAFRQENGYAALRDSLSSESVGFQREALNLIQYLLHENSSDCDIVTQLGFPPIMIHLTSSDDAEVREAALRCLLVLEKGEEGGNNAQLVKKDDKLKHVLQELTEGISAMAPEDLGVAREEIQVLDSLWNACYNEPSSLGEKGPLVLPGEDAPCPFFGFDNDGPPLLHKILSWVPVVSLLRCKSVCKSWRDLIQSSFFIDLHTATTLNSSSSSSYSKFGSFILDTVCDDAKSALIMLSSVSDSEESLSRSGSGGCYCREDDDDDDDQLVVKLVNLGFPSCYKVPLGSIGSRIRVISSCNGIICQRACDNFSLWNPATGQFRILPGPIDIGRHNMAVFGFDVETKDYKVVILTALSPRWNGHGPIDCFFRAQVYNLSTDSWRLLEGIPCLPGHPFFDGCHSDPSGLYLNGSFFLLAHFFYAKHQPCLPENDRFIISFDFTKEIFTPIQLPDHHRNQELYLCYFGDKIALFTAPKFPMSTDFSSIGVNDYRIGSYEDFNIWVLNEHDTSSGSVNKESWEKLHSFQIQIKAPYESYMPRGISNDGKFVLLETRFSDGLGIGLGKNMNLYNLVTKEVKNLLSDFLVSSKAYAYKPSLVSVIGGNGAAAAKPSFKHWWEWEWEWEWECCSSSQLKPIGSLEMSSKAHAYKPIVSNIGGNGNGPNGAATAAEADRVIGNGVQSPCL